jgi:hypothetical protein
VSDSKTEKIKDEIQAKIIELRSNESKLDDEAKAKIEKQKKFCNFILHLHEKTGLRRWKEQVFGVGGDKRYGLLLVETRDKIR